MSVQPPTLQSRELLRRLMREYFHRLEEESKRNNVAWCTSVGPAEILRSFGFEVYFPENHGALLGATRTSQETIPYAVGCGFSADICSYVLSDIGAYLSGRTPLASHYGISGIPRPSLLVYATNQCREVEDWFAFYGRQFGVPVVGIHPPRHLPEVTPADVECVVAQLKNLISVCEQLTGRRFDIDRYREVLAESKKATDLWQACLETAVHSPPPITFWDGCIYMAAIVVLRGLPEATRFYEHLLKELQERINRGEGLHPDRIRLFWDGMPIWGRLRRLADFFREQETAVVASTYCNSWIFSSFDPERPLQSTAKAYTEIFINRSEDAKIQMLRHWCEKYRVDGIVFHDTKTCFNNSNARFGMPERFSRLTGIPSIVVQGDLCDLRFFSEGQTLTRLETFIQQLMLASVQP